jgi:hypothetical protein
MITFRDVTVPTMEGQYWAWLNPLSLLKVVCGGEVTNFTHWLPGLESETDMSIICPLNDNFRLLRFSQSYSNEEISEDLEVDFKARTGDIFELRNKMLAFAVLEYGGITLYTDERIPYSVGEALVDAVVQRGPGPEVRSKVLTRYDRIINASNPDLPVVRSVGRVVLRHKEVNRVLLPDSNARAENRVFSNLK